MIFSQIPQASDLHKNHPIECYQLETFKSGNCSHTGPTQSIDSSKVNKRSFAFIAPVDKIDVIVTDSNLPANVRTQLKSMDIKLHIADV